LLAVWGRGGLYRAIYGMIRFTLGHRPSSRRAMGMAELGHEDLFAPDRLNARCPFS
jgi:hypothetical protein